MSEHARKWLDAWVAANVKPSPFLQQRRMAAEVYAPACLTEAMRTGITRRELERLAGSSLTEFLESAIEDKTDVEVRKARPADWD